MFLKLKSKIYEQLSQLLSIFFKKNSGKQKLVMPLWNKFKPAKAVNHNQLIL